MRQRDQLTLGLAGLALVVSVLFVGGILRWTQALVAILTAAALAMQLLARRGFARTSPLLILFGVAAALSVFQLLPLPESIRLTLDPVCDHLRTDGAELVGTSPWPSISMDPASTLRAVCFFITLAGIGMLALRFSTSERHRFLLLGAVAGTCGLAALVTGIHSVLALDSLFGLYKPIHASPPVLGPLLNTNQLGSLMAFGTVLCSGLVFYERQSVQLRVVWIVIALGCALIAFATGSRGAALNLAIGVIVSLALVLANRLASRTGRRSRRSRLMNDLPIAIVVVFGLGLAVFTSAGNVASQLDQTSITELGQPASKYAAWQSSFDLLAEAPIVGIGRGALEPAFTRVHEASAYVTFSHLENEYIQALIEFGVPGAIVLGLVAALCTWTAMRKWRDGALAAAALGGLTGMAFHSMVDFGVEFLGLAVPVTIVAATVLAVPLREHDTRGRTLLTRGAMIGALLVAAIVLMSSATRSVTEDHDALSGDTDPSPEALKASIERHPLDYYGFAETARILFDKNDGSAVRYLNHALTLHPTLPALHRLAARMLVAGHRNSQAAIEFSLAMRGTVFPHRLVGEIVALLPKAQDAADAIPPDYDKPELVLQSLDELGRNDVALQWLKNVIAQPQHDTDMIDRLYDLAALHRDWETAEYAAQVRIAIAHTTSSRLMLARAYFQLRRYDDVLKELEDVTQWHDRIDEQADAWLITCDVKIERREWDDALECLHRLDGSGLVWGSRRDNVNKRIKHINDERSFDARQHAIEAIEKSIRNKTQTKPL